jgi:hypothetical protein
MVYTTKIQARRNIMFLFLMVFFTNFMSFKTYSVPPRFIILSICFILIYFLFSNQSYLKGKVFSRPLKLTLLSFFLSCIPSIIIFGQNMYTAIAGLTMYIFPVLLYFLLCKWDIDENVIFKYLIYFTVVFALVEIGQQFTYPTYWFGGRVESEFTGLLEQRMGFWRFYLFGISYCLLSMMMCFEKLQNKERPFYKYLIYFLICTIAVYFFLSRKDIYAAVACIFMGVIFSQKRGSFLIKILFSILLVIAYFFLSNSMAELNQQTVMETSEGSEDFIRFIAAEYFIYEMNDSPLYYMFGSGIPGGENSLQKLIYELTEYNKIFQDDCGFVGYFSKFGMFGILIQLLILFKIIANHKYIGIGLLLFALLQLQVCFFDFWGNNTRNLAAWSIYLYLADKNIQRNKVSKENYD